MKKFWANARAGSGTPSLNEAMRARPFQGGYGMVIPLVACFAAVLLLAGPAKAQSSQGLFWQCVPASSTNPQPQYCPVSNQYPLPGGPSINALAAVAGTQRGTSIAGSTGLTIPSGATVALVQFQGTNNASGQCAFWQDDGTAPTATAGQAQPAYTQLWIKASSSFAAIAATGATCTMTVSYYK